MFLCVTNKWKTITFFFFCLWVQTQGLNHELTPRPSTRCTRFSLFALEWLLTAAWHSHLSLSGFLGNTVSVDIMYRVIVKGQGIFLAMRDIYVPKSFQSTSRDSRFFYKFFFSSLSSLLTLLHSFSNTQRKWSWQKHSQRLKTSIYILWTYHKNCRTHLFHTKPELNCLTFERNSKGTWHEFVK